MGDNSAEAIDRRVDEMIQNGREIGVPGELLILIDEVYRPFCHVMAVMEQEHIEIGRARKAAAYLVANIIDEIATATARPKNVKQVRRALVSYVGDILSKETPKPVSGLH